MSKGLSTRHRRLAPTARMLLLPALAAAAVATAATAPAAPASARAPEPTLVGRAVLPFDTFAAGPPAGNFVVPKINNGVTFPLPAQPVQGFSALIAGRSRGEYLAMPDNGFGNKDNSQDFLIRAYYIRPHFKTAAGGTGAVDVGPFISFRDPHHLIGFAIINEHTADRLLTGGDIDPESLQRGRHGDLWVGEDRGGDGGRYRPVSSLRLRVQHEVAGLHRAGPAVPDRGAREHGLGHGGPRPQPPRGPRARWRVRAQGTLPPGLPGGPAAH